MSETLLQEIERHCAATGMAESTFGRGAVNDWSFVRGLRRGRRAWPETVAKVRAFIAASSNLPTADLPLDGAASDGDTRIVTCSVCDLRLDDRTVRGCQALDCPQAEREAA